MSRRSSYESALSLTSQFLFCGLPLRLDSYSKCQFGCCYCFAKARGGNYGDHALTRANALSVAKRIERALSSPPRFALDEFLARKQIIHFGGMSDPFIPLERHARVTYELLGALAELQYPALISTKSDMVARDEYVQVLSRGRFGVQFSLTSLDETFVRTVDAGAPGPKAILAAAKVLRAAGIPVAIRIQPLMPNRVTDALELVLAGAELGVSHFSLEHLKLPIELSRGARQISDALGFDVREHYRSRGARRVGREWILPPQERIASVEEVRRQVRRAGASFGAADNDLLYLSDGNCCCSGADLLLSSSEFFEFNISSAIRTAARNGSEISLNLLAQTWRPTGNVSRYLNSKSRLPSDGSSRRPEIERYLEAAWNGSTSESAPSSFYGVRRLDRADGNGNAVYEIATSARALFANDASQSDPHEASESQTRVNLS